MMCMNNICATKNATYQTFVRIMSFLKKTSPLSGVPDQVSCCSRIRRAAAACGTCTSMRTGFEPHGLAVNRLWMNCLIYFGIYERIMYVLRALCHQFFYHLHSIECWLHFSFLPKYRDCDSSERDVTVTPFARASPAERCRTTQILLSYCNNVMMASYIFLVNTFDAFSLARSLFNRVLPRTNTCLRSWLPMWGPATSCNF